VTTAKSSATAHEQRLARYVHARGDPGLVEALLGVKGVVVGGRHRIETLYNVGGESAVYLTRDKKKPNAPPLIAKIPLYPVHLPIDLDSKVIRKMRTSIRIEGTFLKESDSQFLPKFEGYFEFQNPLLDSARGGAFAEPEPLILMEMLPGQDLDRWLARMHRSKVPQIRMRRCLDRVAVVLLQALVDLYERNLIYADLRPANLRIMGRPERIVRLLDAGSLVHKIYQGDRFPHVPSYLPPQVFKDLTARKKVQPTAEIQSVMAGRTLFEAATGYVPHAGKEVDTSLLKSSNVSPPVAEVVEGLCQGDFTHVRHAYRFLARRAARKVKGGNNPDKITQIVESEPPKRRKKRKPAQKKVQPPRSKPKKAQMQVRVEEKLPFWKRLLRIFRR
jgi:serine/threonine protein kinase